MFSCCFHIAWDQQLLCMNVHFPTITVKAMKPKEALLSLSHSGFIRMGSKKALTAHLCKGGSSFLPKRKAFECLIHLINKVKFLHI